MEYYSAIKRNFWHMYNMDDVKSFNKTMWNKLNTKDKYCIS